MMEDYTNERTRIERTVEEKVVFFFVSVGVIALTLAVFSLFDFLPEKPATEVDTQAMTTESPSVDEAPIRSNTENDASFEVSSVDPLPVSIAIDALGREVQVLNPTQSDVATLDEALLSGVVRHPDSADFQNVGTVFLLGHSSYLPSVMNRNFQAFNGIQNLSWGDTLRVRTGDYEYIYSVDRVYEAKASSAEVPLQFEVPKLVLATCNSFGTKDDRYIVEASLVAKRALNSSV